MRYMYRTQGPAAYRARAAARSRMVLMVRSSAQLAAPTSETSTSRPKWDVRMLYDGECPLCMKEVNFLRRQGGAAKGGQQQCRMHPHALRMCPPKAPTMQVCMHARLQRAWASERLQSALGMSPLPGPYLCTGCLGHECHELLHASWHARTCARAQAHTPLHGHWDWAPCGPSTQGQPAGNVSTVQPASRSTLPHCTLHTANVPCTLCALRVCSRDKGQGRIDFVDIADPNYDPAANAGITFQQASGPGWGWGWR